MRRISGDIIEYDMIDSNNANKYILFKSILSHIKTVPTERKNEAIFVWMDVNCYIPPTLLAHFIWLLRSTPYSPSKENMVVR